MSDWFSKASLGLKIFIICIIFITICAIIITVIKIIQLKRQKCSCETFQMSNEYSKNAKKLDDIALAYTIAWISTLKK